MTTYCLTRGSGQGPEGWRLLSDGLERRGHRVLTPALRLSATDEGAAWHADTFVEALRSRGHQMNRVAGLRDLSADHHHGLVLARKARRAADGDGGRAAGDVWADVEVRFKAELEPHFQIEEALIAPSLEARGEAQIAGRLYEEHAALRQLVAPGAGRTSANLRRFADLLESHIRFEEREFFEVAQKILTPDELSAVAEACRARSGQRP